MGKGEDVQAGQRHGSNIFRPFRAIGIVTDGSRFAHQKRGADNFIVVSVGRAYQLYNCDKLNLRFVGPQLDRTIRAIGFQGDLVFCATGSVVHSYNRTQKVHTYEGHEKTIVGLLTFGSWLLTIGEDKRLCVFDRDDGEVERTIDLGDNFNPTVMCHPHTYLNKILVGSKEGKIRLINVRSGKMLYEFNTQSHLKSDALVAITCIEQSTAIDVVGVGLANGSILLLNLKTDKVVARFQHAGSAVTSISFRTDVNHLMASSGADGMLCIWDLEKRKNVHTIPSIHDGPVGSVKFLPEEPILISSGADNTVKVWIFDQEDGSPRLLKSRSGHCEPPTRIRYYGEAQHILSAGQDRAFRVFNAVRDEQNRELSQKPVIKKAKLSYAKAKDLKLPPILSFSFAEQRDRQWCNVVTCHVDSTKAYTWRYERSVLGEHVLQTTDPTPQVVTSVWVSNCGNFGFIGSASGRIDKYNLQSGLHRGTTQMNDDSHNGPVSAMVSDNLNKQLVSCGFDGFVKFWDFKTLKHIESLSVGVPLSLFEFRRESSLVAAAADDCNIRIFDLDQRRLVRQMKGPTSRITDMAFSPDMRWIVVSSMDPALFVFDIPSSTMIDWYKPHKPITGLTFSPNGVYLATSHVNSVGIYLWTNLSLFSTVYIRASPNTAIDMALPTIGGDNAEATVEIDDGDTATNASVMPKEQLVERMLTLSDVPASRWKSLPNLDVIKRRNKATEAPKAPKAAPFFLPTVPGVELKFADHEEEEEDGEPKSKLIRSGGDTNMKTAFMKLVSEGKDEEALAALKAMAPAATDVEFRSIPLENDLEDLRNLLSMLHARLETGRDFEVVQAWLNLLMKIHGDVMLSSPATIEILNNIRQAQTSTWDRLEDMFDDTMCCLNYCSNMAI